jgi:hypothetical protein
LHISEEVEIGIFEGDPQYPNIHRERWYDKPATNILRFIVINKKSGIAYRTRLIIPQTICLLEKEEVKEEEVNEKKK